MFGEMVAAHQNADLEHLRSAHGEACARVVERDRRIRELEQQIEEMNKRAQLAGAQR